MNSTRDIIAVILTDICNGYYLPAHDMLEWLVGHKGYSLERLLLIAERHFQVPRHLLLNAAVELI